jgi:hypothetical protein
MEITAALAADLAILTEALDEPGIDIADTLRRLAADARTAVDSYLGLTLMVPEGAPTFRITAMDEYATRPDVRASILIPLATGAAPSGPGAVLVLYAANPGAFTDLAADLSWLTGAALTELVLDRHLHLADSADTTGAVRAESIVSQAVGVLIGLGYPPEDAVRELAARASAAGTDRFAAAQHILDNLRRTDPKPLPELD